MISITVHPDALKQIDLLNKHHLSAAVTALTRTAGDAKKDLHVQLGKSLDRPTRYTLNSLFVRPATKNRLYSFVSIKNEDNVNKAGVPPVNFLGPQVEGGPRKIKRFEKVLQMAGHLPRDYMAVPGAGARMDAHGNISTGQIIQILSQLRITPTAGYDRNMRFGRGGINSQRRAGGRFFVIPPGASSPPGVYQREFFGRNITPVLIFVQGVEYRPRYPFGDVATRSVERVFENHFSIALVRALATAR